MSEGLLRVAMFLAYGPFALMVGLYVAALALKWSGRPELLTFLVERTRAQKPVLRGPESEH